MTGRSVVVTGIGIVSALGKGCNANLQAVRSGSSGIRTLTGLIPSDEAGSQWIGGQVEDTWIDSSRHDRFVRLALTAASEAVEQARLSGDPARRGVVIGTGLGGSETLERNYHRLYRKGSRRLPPMTIPSAMYNAATSAVSSAYEARGPAWAVVSACTSATHSIGQGLDWIRSGRADVVLAGGADAPLQPGIILAWEALRVLAPAGDDPASACRPFAANRRGLVLAEGAAVLVLESSEHAHARGALPLAEISGAGFSSDAGHLTDPTIEGPASAMRQALLDAGVDSSDVGYVNAHGTGTRANDLIETAALKDVFGASSPGPPASSTKSMHGHAMGASGAIELALSILSLREGFLPPTINLTEPDPECDLDYVPLTARPTDTRVVMSNSFGFGGLNGVVVARIVPS